MHVLFVREHNRIAEEVHEDNPDLDEEIFEIARKINTAQMQYITYYEYLPSLGINLPHTKDLMKAQIREFPMGLQPLLLEWGILKSPILL